MLKLEEGEKPEGGDSNYILQPAPKKVEVEESK
jgi:hypothetical protein